MEHQKDYIYMVEIWIFSTKMLLFSLSEAMSILLTYLAVTLIKVNSNSDRICKRGSGQRKLLENFTIETYSKISKAMTLFLLTYSGCTKLTFSETQLKRLTSWEHKVQREESTKCYKNQSTRWNWNYNERIMSIG